MSKNFYNYIETPLGRMIAAGDEHALSFLQFEDKSRLAPVAQWVQAKTAVPVERGITAPIRSIQQELDLYFAGTLVQFKTPVQLLGTGFHTAIWRALQTIPYGHTKSYAQLAAFIGKPSAFRAAANANAVNPLVIVVPCHRVIKSSGDLCGFSAGIERKKWLLAHETRMSNVSKSR